MFLHACGENAARLRFCHPDRPLATVHPSRSPAGLAPPAVALMGILLLCLPAWAAESLTDRIERVEPAVVRIDVRGFVGERVGSGFAAEDLP